MNKLIKRMAHAAAATGMAGACLLGATTAANAAPAGSEWPTSWTISGNTATGTSPSGVTVTATISGGPGRLVATGTSSASSYSPAGISHLAFDNNGTNCGVGPAACGTVTFTFSKPVQSASFSTSGAGSSYGQDNVNTNVSNLPVTLLSGGTFALDRLGQNAAMEIRNGGTTFGMTQSALNAPIGKTGDPSCTENLNGTILLGCGAYDVNLGGAPLTSLTVGLGYADASNKTSTDAVNASRILALGFVPVSAGETPMIDPAVGAGTIAVVGTALAGGALIRNHRKRQLANA